jgi:hypothetical protein
MFVNYSSLKCPFAPCSYSYQTAALHQVCNSVIYVNVSSTKDFWHFVVSYTRVVLIYKRTKLLSLNAQRISVVQKTAAKVPAV